MLLRECPYPIPGTTGGRSATLCRQLARGTSAAGVAIGTAVVSEDSAGCINKNRAGAPLYARNTGKKALAETMRNVPHNIQWRP